MGVLDAWIGADKVGYPVVGEKIKDADNVIDYNIREEVTKDVSAEVNANNQTTTGMATVIPGVNAPKLLEKTSIISEPEIGYISASLTFASRNMTETGSTPFTPTTISDEVGKYKFTKEGEFVYIPVDGAYKLDITRPACVKTSSHSHYWYTNITSRDGVVTYYNAYYGESGRHTSTVVAALKKGNWLHVEGTVLGTVTELYPTTGYVNINISRISGI